MKNNIEIEIHEKKVVLPFLILTKNLIIRPLLNQDYNVILDSVRASLGELQMWLPWMEKSPAKDEYIFITNKLFEEANAGKHCHFCVYHNEIFLGVCSYMDIDSNDKIIKIGFWCKTSANDDYNFIDAVNAIIKYGFENCRITKFHIPCVAGNYLTEILAKNLKFKLSSVDLIDSKQIKNFYIDAKSPLPPLEMQIVNGIR